MKNFKITIIKKDSSLEPDTYVVEALTEQEAELSLCDNIYNESSVVIFTEELFN